MKTIYETIIVGIDDTERAKEILEKAARVAKVAEANLIVVSTIPYDQIVSFNYAGMDPVVLSQYVVPDQNEIESIINERKSFVDATVKEIDTTGIKEVKQIVEINDAATKIVKLAEENEASLIVIGSTEKKAIERFILGSVARQITNSSPVDVLLAR